MRTSLTALCLLAACASPTGVGLPDTGGQIRSPSPGVIEERRTGTIEFYHDPVVVGVPDAVNRGESFTVTVRTYGSGCIRQGDTVVRTVGSTATVTPFDWEVVRAPQNTVCTRELRFYAHTASVRFDEPGTAVVEVVGRRRPGDDTVRVRREVTVR